MTVTSVMSANQYQKGGNEDTFDAWLAGRVSQEADDRLLTDGTVLSEYKVVALLGRGGCGEVYSARHEKLGSMAAIKILFKNTPQMRIRFEREAKILAEKRYREFPLFISYGEYKGHPYIYHRRTAVVATVADYGCGSRNVSNKSGDCRRTASRHGTCPS